MSEEIWKAVPGYEGRYEVSDQGRVRSLDRVDRFGRTHCGLVLKQKKAGGKIKYPTVSLCRGGVIATRYVHHLILEAFVGPRPSGHQACHDRGLAAGNVLGNLRYDTIAENQRDRMGQGTDQLGEHNTQAKLTTEDVLVIRKSKARGVDLAPIYAVSTSTISAIRTGKGWPHV